MGPGAWVMRAVALFVTEGAWTEKAGAGSAGVRLPRLPLSADHVLGVLSPVPWAWAVPPPPWTVREGLCMHCSAERL